MEYLPEMLMRGWMKYPATSHQVKWGCEACGKPIAIGQLVVEDPGGQVFDLTCAEGAAEAETERALYSQSQP